jgi:uncharacterized membrane protein YgcG
MHSYSLTRGVAVPFGQKKPLPSLKQDSQNAAMTAPPPAATASQSFSDWKKTGFLAALAAAPFLAPAVAQAQQPVAPAGQTLYSDVNPQTGLPIRNVTKATDLPHINQSLNQRIIDLMNNPLISDAAKARVLQIANKLHDDGVAELAVVVIPDTSLRSIKNLNTDLFNQISLGDRNRHNGVLVLMNAQGIRENRSIGKMAIEPGDGLMRVLSNQASVDLLKQHALPALERGNPDQAIIQTVDAIDALLRSSKTEQAPTSSTGTQASGGGISAETGQAILYTLLGLALLVGGGIGTVVAFKALSDRKQQAAMVQDGMNAIGSGYRVGVSNRFSPETFEALFASPQVDLSAASSEEQKAAILQAAADRLQKAMAYVANNLWTKPNGPSRNEILSKTYLEKGLSHAFPEVREQSVATLGELGVVSPKELFTALMTQLAVEDNKAVIDAMTPVITQNAAKEDLPHFERLLTNANPEVREIGISGLNKFADAGTPSRFFGLLGTEQNQNLIELLQVYLTRLAKADNRDLFLTQFNAPANIHAKKAAIQGLGAIQNTQDFPALFTAYQANTELYLDQPYVDAVESTSAKEHLPLAHTGLKHGESRVNNLSLSIINKHPSGSSFDPLFAYLGSKLAAGKAEALTVVPPILGKCTEAGNREFIFQQAREATDARLRKVAVDVMGKVTTAANVPTFFELLDAEGDKHVQDAIFALIQREADASNRTFLLEKLSATKPTTRLAAVSGLKTVAQSQDVPRLFTVLEGENNTEIRDALQQAIGNAANDSNCGLLFDKIQAPKPAVRKAAALGLQKTVVVTDLPKLFGLWDNENDASVKQDLKGMTEALAKKGDVAFDPLNATLQQNQSATVQLAVVPLLGQFGLRALGPLFEALGRTGGNTQMAVVNKLRETILPIGSKEQALPQALEYANSRHPEVSKVAVECVTDLIEDWSRKADFDNGNVMNQLEKLGRNNKSAISSKARQVRERFIQDKVREVEQIGNSGSFQQRSNFDTLRTIATTVAIVEVSQAASRALNRLERRLSDYEAAEARRRAEEEAERRRRAEESSRSSSYGGSDWGGGGGISTGGMSSGGGGGEI